MALVERLRSKLNPNAPMFIPAAYRQVEDFSPEWWELVKTSTWFRDYWLSEYPEDSFNGDGVVDSLPENLDFEFDYDEEEEEEEFALTLREDQQKRHPPLINGVVMDVIKELSIPLKCNGKERWSNGSVKPAVVKAAKYQMKPVSPKSAAPRRIYQPR